MKESRAIVKVAFLYLTTIIGAGFASGQEIMQFFSKYNENSFWGIILSGILFSFIGIIVLYKVYTERIKDYSEFLYPLVGFKLGFLIEIIVTFFVFSVFSIMISGSSFIISKEFNIPFFISILIISLFCIIVMVNGVKGVILLSSIATPIILLGIVFSGMYVICFRTSSAFNPIQQFKLITDNYFCSALIYVSYNSILSVVLMCSLLPYLKSKKVAIMGGMLGGGFLCLIALIINFIIFGAYSEVKYDQIPLIAVLLKYNYLISQCYKIVLFLAMLLAALSAGICFITRINNRVNNRVNINKKLIIISSILFTIPLSFMGFSNLISILYPIFGYLGMFMMFIIIFNGFKIIFNKH